jgi:hypothetical protein
MLPKSHGLCLKIRVLEHVYNAAKLSHGPGDTCSLVFQMICRYMAMDAQASDI